MNLVGEKMTSKETIRQELAQKQAEQLEAMGQYFNLNEQLTEVRKQIVGYGTAIGSLSALLEVAEKLEHDKNKSGELMTGEPGED